VEDMEIEVVEEDETTLAKVEVEDEKVHMLP